MKKVAKQARPVENLVQVQFTELVGEHITRVQTHVGGAHLFTKSGRKFETYANMQRGAVLMEIK